MRNKDVREYAANRKVKLWRMAAELNINDGNFSFLKRLCYIQPVRYPDST